MKKLNSFIILLLIGFLLISPAKKSMACMGTPCPDCCRTAWLAKFTSSTVLFPSTTAPVTVPISMLPFASWITSQTLGCPAPTSASLAVTLTCTPVGGGPTITIPSTTFTAATPVAPGLQPLIAVPFVIPAGTFATLTPQICTVVGVYTVTFADGTSISGTGDTQVCLVSPSEVDPNIPELNVEFVKINGEDFVTCKKGDQTTLFYLVENNDENRSVSLTVNSTTNQVAKMPTSSDPNDTTLFAISDPAEGTDAFFQKFSDSGDPGALIDPPDPMENSNREITRDISIPPKGITIVSIDMRSWGMCADGSCSDNLVVFQGEWSDGSPALGCAGTAVVVGDVAPKSALCDVEDAVKSSANANIDWGAAEFSDVNGPIVAGMTFPHGQSTSQNLVNFMDSASEILRTDLPPTSVNWNTSGFANFPDADILFQNVKMDVNVTGLTPELPFALPIVGFGTVNESNLGLQIDMGLDTLTIIDLKDTQQITLEQDIFSDIDGDGVGDQEGDSFPKGEEISGGRIEGGFIIDPEEGCDCRHLHGSIFVDGKGPFPDPDTFGCGFGCVTDLTTGGTEIFSGSFSGFFEAPPDGFNIDHDTCRTINITCPPDAEELSILALNPPAFADTLGQNETKSLDFEVLNARNQQKTAWTATGSFPGITPESSTGGAGTDLKVMVDPSQIALFPTTTGTIIEVDSGNALAKYNLPVFARNTGEDAEICDNGIDDDNDTFIDCDDEDCQSDPACGPAELGSLEANPDAVSGFRATVIITANDKNNDPIPGINIEGNAEGLFAKVRPSSATTDENGEAEFAVRLPGRSSIATFSSGDISITVGK